MGVGWLDTLGADTERLAELRPDIPVKLHEGNDPERSKRVWGGGC